MSSKKTILAILAASLLPTPALAHPGILASADPVAALLHFVSQPDHAAGLVLLVLAAFMLAPRVRTSVCAALTRLDRRR